jgi:hypothetical protein
VRLRNASSLATRRLPASIQHLACGKPVQRRHLLRQRFALEHDAFTRELLRRGCELVPCAASGIRGLDRASAFFREHRLRLGDDRA